MENLYSVPKNKSKEENSLQLRGSLTVESALVLPLFFLTIVVLAGLLDLYRIGVLIQSSLCEGAKELGMYAYSREGDDGSPVGMVDSGVCVAYGTQKVRSKLKKEQLSGIQGGINGITLLGSGMKNGMVILKASFFYRCPVPLFTIFPVKVEFCGQARAWTGYEGQVYGTETSEELVYITNWQSVYHTSRECTHLELAVYRVSLSDIETRRNEYGERYQPCERCVDEDGQKGLVYITDTGNHYHGYENCGGITRSVKAVKKSEVQNLEPCIRCKGG